MEPSVKDNTERKQFEYNVDGHTAWVEYILNSSGMIFLTNTEVPKPIRGRGLSFQMIGQVLQIVEERGLKLVPLCPTVAEFIRRNPEWKRLLAENFNV